MKFTHNINSKVLVYKEIKFNTLQVKQEMGEFLMDIFKIAKKIQDAGGSLYLVGGAIRDEIMKKEVYDRDYCVCGISKEKFRELFPDAKRRGKAFEVFDIERTEFALARRERKIGFGHIGFETDISEDITIEEDLARRDITINAIAKEVLTEKIVDPFNGIDDIRNGIIRKTTNAFLEDPLRVYRVARIATKTGFIVEKETLELMNLLKEELLTLSKERVFCELEKALRENQPSIFFNVLRKADVLDVHFKEIYDLIGVEQPIKYHPEGDAYNHTMIALDNASKLTNDISIHFAVLVHDLGKGVTPKNMYPHHYGHDEKGVEVVQKFGQRVGVPKKWISYGKVASLEHMRGGIFYKMTPKKQVSFIEKVAKSKLGLHGLQIVVLADKNRTDNTNLQDIEFEEIGKRCIKEVNGEYIKEKYGIQEGIKFKEKLHEERVRWMKERKNVCENIDNINNI